MAKVYIFLADGFEEVEGLTTVDLLRRAEIEVVMISIMGRHEVTGANGITVKADKLFEDIDVSDADMLILPGGQPGTTNLGAYKPLTEVLLKWNAKGGKLAAICAAPMVFGGLGLLKGRRATCYPGCEGGLDGAHTSEERVVTDGNITTSRGVGTAIAFGLELITILVNRETADTIKSSIVYGH
ncbi:DJ-1/PfpI family protein [Ruminococcus sp. OA3]|uniref:DJ-1 family glyoxalase III n=1 Tax=Ruminococcus sp. OA3 TaxID=2914164 RepID=UPI001F054D5C|nr:DJ-1 family glyoxalase III [Ruminococcus sp. OA3]MCH1981011.1 DJ-1/PfpI family protein [Ruminococcus sp. OA3]